MRLSGSSVCNGFLFRWLITFIFMLVLFKVYLTSNAIFKTHHLMTFKLLNIYESVCKTKGMGSPVTPISFYVLQESYCPLYTISMLFLL